MDRQTDMHTDGQTYKRTNSVLFSRLRKIDDETTDRNGNNAVNASMTD